MRLRRMSKTTRARQALTLLLLQAKEEEKDEKQTVKAIEFFDQLEIYPGTFPLRFALGVPKDPLTLNRLQADTLQKVTQEDWNTILGDGKPTLFSVAERLQFLPSCSSTMSTGTKRLSLWVISTVFH